VHARLQVSVCSSIICALCSKHTDTEKHTAFDQLIWIAQPVALQTPEIGIIQEWCHRHQIGPMRDNTNLYFHHLSQWVKIYWRFRNQRRFAWAHILSYECYERSHELIVSKSKYLRSSCNWCLSSTKKHNCRISHSRCYYLFGSEKFRVRLCTAKGRYLFNWKIQFFRVWLRPQWQFLEILSTPHRSAFFDVTIWQSKWMIWHSPYETLSYFGFGPGFVRICWKLAHNVPWKLQRSLYVPNLITVYFRICGNGDQKTA